MYEKEDSESMRRNSLSNSRKGGETKREMVGGRADGRGEGERVVEKSRGLEEEVRVHRQ